MKLTKKFTALFWNDDTIAGTGESPKRGICQVPVP